MSDGAPEVERNGPQINVSKIVAGGGAAGAIFTVASMAIFLIGIPALRYFLPAAIVLGGGMAIAIHFVSHETPGKPWIPAEAKIPSDTKK
jgi:hypothetical protein